MGFGIQDKRAMLTMFGVASGVEHDVKRHLDKQYGYIIRSCSALSGVKLGLSCRSALGLKSGQKKRQTASAAIHQSP